MTLNSVYTKIRTPSFEDVDEVERRMIREALLRYCELDTLAMVMIVQGWREAVGCWRGDLILVRA